MDIGTIEILIAFILDLIFGDPEYKLHPVRIIGYAIIFFKKHFRKISKNQKVNGLLFVIFIIGLFFSATYVAVYLGAIIDKLLGINIIKSIISIFLIYSSIALTDLKKKAMEIYKALKNNAIIKARQKLSMIVGRDTDRLNKKEIIRATVETVSENIVDGIISPLLFAFIGGAPLAILYKAINTLDSIVGYKNKEYIDFGRASAIIDDAANFIPARIAGILIPLASFIYLKNGYRSFKFFLRDGNKNPSPNSGIPEACVSGALGIQLGGINYYKNKKSEKPLIGDRIKGLDIRHIKESILIAYLTTILFIGIGIIVKYFIISIIIYM